ncbi:hypothetical protein B0I35DRAFT_476638 [Stachybotrys elegans]|uniref:Ankyrin repeat protein n=1 Tax=Stachybotrys elegans TaxID=80388 RepID=A0A8K0SVN3_9HYPO|nr:hypothetical protein B0I35DRAFT_476638 [Stachybotrys elegans]
MTVPQAWIWRIGEDLIVAIPWLQNHIGYTKDFGSKYILNPLLKISGVSTDHIIGLLLTELITSLDRPNIAGYYEPILTVFAKEIATISVNVDEYIRDSNIGNITVEMEKGFVHDISDIREELSMMNRVLSQQEEIWREFALDAWPDAENWPEGVNGRFILKKDRTSAHHRDAPGDTTSSESDNLNDRKIAEIRRQIEKPQYVIAKFKRRIADLDEDAERVEKSIQIRLDLVQKHLALRETRSMSVMSASVFAFTIITIIFTPLSFATSLFALSVDEFARHQITIPDREDPVYGTGYIVASLLSIEISALIITVVAILASLKYFLRMDIKQILEEIWKGFKQEREPAGTSEDSPVSGEQTPSRKSVQESGQADETAASVPTKKPLHRRLQSFGPKDWARGLRRRRNSDREPGYEMTEPGSRQ